MTLARRGGGSPPPPSKDGLSTEGEELKTLPRSLHFTDNGLEPGQLSKRAGFPQLERSEAGAAARLGPSRHSRARGERTWQRCQPRANIQRALAARKPCLFSGLPGGRTTYTLNKTHRDKREPSMNEAVVRSSLRNAYISGMKLYLW